MAKRDDLTPEEQDEEWRRWQERETVADRLWDAINEASEPPSIPLDEIFFPKHEPDWRDYDYSGPPDSGCSLKFCLLTLIILLVLGCFSWQILVYFLLYLPELMDWFFAKI